MPLIKDGRIVEDRWTPVRDIAEARAVSAPLVPLTLWQEHRDEFLTGKKGYGLRLESDETPDLLLGDLGFLELVALSFPKFTDGRAYSHARILREHHGFKGEIRAVGDIQRDQVHFMHRCGIDTFEVPDSSDVQNWDAALGEIELAYQPATRGNSTIQLRRQSRARPTVAATAPDTCAAH